jgi:1-aminocyclopropane-1-carboxylate deaminase
MYYFVALLMGPSLSHIRTESLKNLYQPFGVGVSVLRLDEIDGAISGNKWFKLRHYLQAAVTNKKKGLLTFGGPWSNHILATAAACQRAGLGCVAIIRGERPATPSQTLTDVEQMGTKLYFTDRSAYAKKEVPEALHAEMDNWVLVPEGGYGKEGLAGAADIAALTDWSHYTHVLSAVGTGTTLAGLIRASTAGSMTNIGINVLKNAGAGDAVAALLPVELKDRIHIMHRFHEGGYARHTPKLLSFMNAWYEKTGIPSDFVYTGKLFLGANTLISEGYFLEGSRLLLIHSGGLQGNRSLPAGTLIF